MTTQSGLLPTVLTIAGTDPTGGAGLQADIKAISEAGAFPFSVVTSLVAQNTQGVREIHTPPMSFLRAQLDAVFDDVRVDAIKIGMLGTTEIIRVVAEYLEQHPDITVVLDPVMVATSGDRLLDKKSEQELKEVCRRARVITPNLPELAVLAGKDEADSLDAAVRQATNVAGDLGCAVLVKGGHLTGGDNERADNVWVEPSGETFPAPTRRVDTRNTHGTGCSLSSALAGRLAAGDEPGEAAVWATNWLAEAIAHADDLHIGKGNGPVDHTHRSRRLAQSASTTPWGELAAIPAELSRPEDLAGVADAANVAEGADGKTEAPAPLVEAAGPWTKALWEASGAVMDASTKGAFVQALGSGNLSEKDFRFYLAQDALYLERYSPSLGRLGTQAPTTEDRQAWLRDAVMTIDEEASLHRGVLGDAIATTQPSPVTLSYTNFLDAATGTQPYPVGAAAVLPCYWLYAHIGAHLAAQSHEGHPFKKWLDEYGADDFMDNTREAIARTERALAGASPAERAQAARAFLSACYLERDFFEQALRVL